MGKFSYCSRVFPHIILLGVLRTLLPKIEGPREKSGSPEVYLFPPYCVSARTPLSLNHSPVFSTALKFKMVSNAFLISSHSHEREQFEGKKGVYTVLIKDSRDRIRFKSFSFIL